MIYALLADLLLTFHIGIVLFVVLGLIAIWVGVWRKWTWIRNPWFRWSHLICVGIIVIQSWLGKLCPLTIWEMTLREKAGETTYAGSFIAHWLEELLYIEAPLWAFIIAYTLFGSLVLISTLLVRPAPFRAHPHRELG